MSACHLGGAVDQEPAVGEDNQFVDLVLVGYSDGLGSRLGPGSWLNQHNTYRSTTILIFLYFL